MATSNNDRISSAKLATFATKLWTKIKSTFYIKPNDGIPKSDLDSSVQSSLDKADSALQSHQDISGKVNKSGDTMTGNLEVKRTNATSEVRTYNTAAGTHFTIGNANGANGAQRGLYDSKLGNGKWVFRISGNDKEIELNHRTRVDTLLDVKRLSSASGSETDMRVFKPGNIDDDSHPHLNLYYGVNNVRGIWDSVKNADVLEIKADNSVVLHGTSDLASAVSTNGKTNSVTSGSTLCLTSGGAFSNLLRKGTVGGFFVFNSTIRKQLANRNTWYNLSQNLPFTMPPKSAVLLTFSVVGMNADQSLSPANTFTVKFYCGTSSPPADGSKDIYIYAKQMAAGVNKVTPVLAVNDSDETKNFFLWARANDSYDVNYYLDGGSIWGTGLHGSDFIPI